MSILFLLSVHKVPSVTMGCLRKDQTACHALYFVLLSYTSSSLVPKSKGVDPKTRLESISLYDYDVVTG